MIRAHTDLHVASTPEDVFDRMADMRNELHWNPNVTEMTKAGDGPVGPGARFEGRMKRVGPMYMVISEYDRPRRLRMTGGGRPANVDFAASFEPAEAGTRVDATLEMQPKGLGKYFARLLRGQVQRQEEETLERFKRWVESSSSAPG
jgi:carbon monoxide dehydrogenase subunit G